MEMEGYQKAGVKSKDVVHVNITVSYTPAKDAENHVHAIFDNVYNTYGRTRMKERLLTKVELDVVKKILETGENRDEALQAITTMFTDRSDRGALEQKAKDLEATWSKLGDQIVLQLEALYNQNCPFDIVHIDLTTLPICPYNFKEKQIFVHAAPGIQTQLRILSHELNHFFFYHVYSNDLGQKLGKEKFELLKESMTIFTNPEQGGKPDEEPLRKLYIKKRTRSLNEAVKIGSDFLLQ